eukprot:g41269.t1
MRLAVLTLWIGLISAASPGQILTASDGQKASPDDTEFASEGDIEKTYTFYQPPPAFPAMAPAVSISPFQPLPRLHQEPSAAMIYNNNNNNNNNNMMNSVSSNADGGQNNLPAASYAIEELSVVVATRPQNTDTDMDQRQRNPILALLPQVAVVDSQRGTTTARLSLLETQRFGGALMGKVVVNKMRTAFIAQQAKQSLIYQLRTDGQKGSSALTRSYLRSPAFETIMGPMGQESGINAIEYIYTRGGPDSLLVGASFRSNPLLLVLLDGKLTLHPEVIQVQVEDVDGIWQNVFGIQSMTILPCKRLALQVYNQAFPPVYSTLLLQSRDSWRTAFIVGQDSRQFVDPDRPNLPYQIVSVSNAQNGPVVSVSNAQNGPGASKGSVWVSIFPMDPSAFEEGLNILRRVVFSPVR